MTVELNSLLVRTPGINGGRLCLEGTGFSVHQTAILFQRGYSAEDVGFHYPHLKMSHVYAALAYYLANRDEVDRELAAEEAGYNRVRDAQLAVR